MSIKTGLSFSLTFCYIITLLFAIVDKVYLHGSRYVIHKEVLNFHDWIFLLSWAFSQQDKKMKIIEIINGHLINIKIILTIWTLKYVDCFSFSFIDFFLYYSQLSQLIYKNIFLKFAKNMIKPPWFNQCIGLDIYRLIFKLCCVWWNQMVVCLF